MNVIMGYAQSSGDTIKPLRINPKLHNMIHFHGYMQKRSNDLVIIDSLHFNGIHTVKRLSIKEFMRLTQADAEKYRKVMKEIYEPLIEEQQRIIDNANAQNATLKYDPALGFSADPMKAPTEMMNQNKHQEKKEDYFKNWDAKEAEIMQKYLPLK